MDFDMFDKKRVGTNVEKKQKGKKFIHKEIPIPPNHPIPTKTNQQINKKPRKPTVSRIIDHPSARGRKSFHMLLPETVREGLFDRWYRI